MPVVWTLKEKCKRCYTCIRECPARAIRVEAGQAGVIPERCIGCGHCVKVCSQEAKEILSGEENVLNWLSAAREGKGKVVALIAPSFPAAFIDVPYKKFVGALRELGFSRVIQVAYGAEIVNYFYKEMVDSDCPETGKKPLFTTTCPALVEYIEKYIPELIPQMAKIVSPMIAIGKIVKQTEGNDCKTVFIGPCIAKKKERQRENYSQIIDEVLTFQEIKTIIQGAGINFENTQESGFDGPYPGLAKIYPIPGGLVRSAGFNYDILDNSIIFTEGKKNVLKLLDLTKKDEVSAKLVDMLFCEGCINGPGVDNDVNIFTRKQKVVEFAEHGHEQPFDRDFFKDVIKNMDFSTEFRANDQRIPDPDEEQIRDVLKKTNKFSEKDELNCGACGYETCRDYAIAMIKGLAEDEMCLPYLIEKLQKTHKDLEKSLVELQEMQEQVIQSEKLASLGQLAAGVAHEVNNPLGSIILHAHLLKQNLKDDYQNINDLKMIIEEATRCKNIVAGLLDFARQGKLNLQKVNIHQFLSHILNQIRIDSRFKDVEIIEQVKPNLEATLDPEQFKQVFINLLNNAADALEKNVNPQIRIKVYNEDNWLHIIIEDNGCGIPEENMKHLFTPFFTTKPPGKGTGLGLPIVYGIVKMHKGQITIQSRENKGTKVHIKIPVYLNEGGNHHAEKNTVC